MKQQISRDFMAHDLPQLLLAERKERIMNVTLRRIQMDSTCLLSFCTGVSMLLLASRSKGGLHGYTVDERFLYGGKHFDVWQRKYLEYHIQCLRVVIRELQKGGGAAKNKRYLLRIITKSTKGGWNLFKLVDKQNNFM